MADFERVLRETIDGLKDSSDVMRAKVYDKARSTIERKLDALAPAPPQAIIDRQMQALEDAIKVVELEYSEPRRNFTWLSEYQQRAPIRAWADSLQLAGQVPTEPDVKRGPNFTVQGSRLSLAKQSVEDSDQVQERLHRHLRRQTDDVLSSLAKLENRYPELTRTTRLYQELLLADTNALDLVSVWSIGNTVLSLEAAYRAQNPSLTYSEPLEPATLSGLAALARNHGAFIMGFAETRELVDRADQFAADANVSSIEAPGAELLEGFIDPRLVDQNTRKITLPVRDFVIQRGWAGSRVGYSAYLTVRNGLIAMLRLIVGSNPSALEIVGGVSVAAEIVGMPTTEFMKVAVPWLQQNSSQILAFFQHSPECRSYAEYTMQLLEIEARPEDGASGLRKNLP